MQNKSVPELIQACNWFQACSSDCKHDLVPKFVGKLARNFGLFPVIE